MIDPARGEPAWGDRALGAGSGVGALDGGRTGEAAAAAVEGGVGEALADLVATLERAGDELLAAVPFLGDQATAASVNAFVDEVVSAIHALRADADDLRRVVAIRDQGRPGAR